MQVAQRMQTLGGLGDAFASFDSLDQLLRQGIDIVDFTVGDPDFATPAHIADAGIKAISDGHTHYTPSRGIAPLRRRIAESLTTSRRVKFDAEEIVVAPGAKILVTYALLALINPGDEVIVPDPGYPAYRSMVEFVGGIPVPMPLLEERSFAFDPATLAALVSDKTRMIVINSPNNPTGGLLSADDLNAVAEIVRCGDIWVLSDEVYSEMVYDRPFLSIASIPGMKERTILLDSFSKIYAMTGWRLGYGAASKPVADAMSLLAGNIHSSAAEFTQHASLAALEGTRAPLDAMVTEYRERRDLLWEGLNKLPGFSCVKA
ncbi:MAG: aminotransferase class I/II-fold pyridoxal phosphate-dependent enzyme [Chloroflexi bacterium]|nr:aminotransferase class I/II-fold pyridoxal phosphate-dependent enzyme [Chloroflexota bacterium]